MRKVFLSSSQNKNNALDEGYIKFDLEWVERPPLDLTSIQELNYWRAICFEQNLIGETKGGIGFGNISRRTRAGFIISGTQTGGVPILGPEHYTEVTAFEIDRNWLRSEGPVKASSESMTHAALYEAKASIAAVIHVHDSPLWTYLLQSAPTTEAHIPYGTPEMAREVQRLAALPEFAETGIFAMKGHEDGVITFGPSLAHAGGLLLSLKNDLSDLE